MLLLLDLDNTVADRETAFQAWALRKVADWGLGEDALAYITRADGDGFRPRAEFFADVRAHFDLEDDELGPEYRAVTLEAFPPIASSVARALRGYRVAGWRIAVVTNGEAGVQEATADRVGITPLVDAVVVSGTVGTSKPARRIFEIAADAAGASLASAWMVGDGEPDVLGARNVGIPSVWIARSRRWTRTDFAPDRVAANINAALIIPRDPEAGADVSPGTT
jgi:putative hydrolase of the HAD superfamily